MTLGVVIGKVLTEEQSDVVPATGERMMQLVKELGFGQLVGAFPAVAQ